VKVFMTFSRFSSLIQENVETLNGFNYKMDKHSKK